MYHGKKLTLCGIIHKNRSMVREFLEGLGKRNQAQMANLLKYTSDNGPPNNEEKFKNLGHGIYEFKTRSGFRILCFWGHSNSIILTHGFPKCKPRRLETEKQKALSWYSEYLKLVEK